MAQGHIPYFPPAGTDPFSPPYLLEIPDGGFVGGEIDITDGTTTVTGAATLRFPAGTIADNGSGEAEYTPASGGGENLTPPNDGDFAWINQGSASVDTSGDGILLTAPSTSGNTIRIRKKSAPSTPYTVTAKISPTFFKIGIQGFGLCFRESGSGEIHTFGIQHDAVGAFPYIVHSKWDDATTYNSEYNSYSGSSLLRTHGAIPTWLRIADDGTDRICSLSYDGRDFAEWQRIGRTDFLTANEIGYFVRDVSGAATSARLLSWEEA